MHTYNYYQLLIYNLQQMQTPVTEGGGGPGLSFLIRIPNSKTY